MSDAAYEVGPALIDAYPGLSNIVGGHYNELRGCHSVNEINRDYAAEPHVAHEPLILIFVGRLITERVDIYNAVRGVWKMSLAKAEQRQLVLAYDGVTVAGAFGPTKWMEASTANFALLKKDVLDRIGFEGHPTEVKDEYLGKRVPRVRVTQLTRFAICPDRSDSASHGRGRLVIRLLPAIDMRDCSPYVRVGSRAVLSRRYRGSDADR